MNMFLFAIVYFVFVLIGGIHVLYLHNKELPSKGYAELEISRVFRFIMIFIFGGFFQEIG